MSTDTAIRRVTISEQAREAALRFLQTGEEQEHHHEGADAAAWELAYERYKLAPRVGDETEGGA